MEAIKQFPKRLIPKTKINEFKIAPLHEKLYEICIYGGLLVFIFLGLSIRFLKIDNTKSITDISFSMIGITIIIATVLDIYPTLKNWWKTKPWIKVIFAGYTFIAYKFSAMYSDKFINETTSLDPSQLPKAAIFLTSAYLPYAWLLVTAITLLIASLLLMFYGFLKNLITKKSEKYMPIKIVGILLTSLLLLYSVEIFEDRGSWYSKLSKHLILTSSYFKKSECTTIPENVFVADIGRGYISLYNPNSDEFSVTRCVYPE